MSIDDVLVFWFGEPASDAAALGVKMRRWYQGGPELDRAIQDRFGALVAQAVAGELDGWAETTRGRLALIILLDQLTRSVYRDDPRMYEGDARAQRLAVEALDRGLERELPTEERSFLIMPLLHAEDLALQERVVAEMERLIAAAETWQRPIFSMGQEQARKYRDVIARFGRFPHRNAILGRASTPEEQTFLQDWKQKQPPSTFKQVTET